MRFCGNCGAPLDEGVRFCSSCGARQTEGAAGHSSGTGRPSGHEEDKSVGSKVGDIAGSTAKKISDTASGMKDAYNDKMADLSKRSVQLSDGEIPVREYEASRMFFPIVPGKLLITNKRILFYSKSLTSKVIMSTPLNTVGSIQMFYGRDELFFKGTIIGVVIFIILAVIMHMTSSLTRSMYSAYGGLFGTPSVSYGSGLTGLFVFLMIVDVAVIVVLWLRKTIHLSISAVNSGPGITLGRTNGMGFSLNSIRGVAGKDAGHLMDEIGAVILDLQQQGDIAIEKWKNI